MRIKNIISGRNIFISSHSTYSHKYDRNSGLIAHLLNFMLSACRVCLAIFWFPQFEVETLSSAS